MSKTTKNCGRCGKRYRGKGAWNGVFRLGVLTDLICPGCQTAEENAEAEVNSATLNYATTTDGRFIGIAKT